MTRNPFPTDGRERPRTKSGRIRIWTTLRNEEDVGRELGVQFYDCTDQEVPYGYLGEVYVSQEAFTLIMTLMEMI